MKRGRWLVVALLIVVLAFSFALPPAPSHAYTKFTHQQLLQYGLKTLNTDPPTTEAQSITPAKRKAAFKWWEHYFEYAYAMVADVDRPEKFLLFDPPTPPMEHGWNPDTNRGWCNAKGALWLADTYYGKAWNTFKRDKPATHPYASLYMGVVCHLIADMTVPHHTVWSDTKDGIPSQDELASHKAYEHSAPDIDVEAWGAYGIYHLREIGYSGEDKMLRAPASAWLRYAVLNSRLKYKTVGPNTPQARAYDKQTHKEMCILAGRLLAGFMYTSYYQLYRKPN